MGADECLDDVMTIFRLVVLQKGALVEFFLCGFWNIDRLHRLRVQTGVEHTGAHGAGGGVEVLHLLRANMIFL